MDGLVTWPARSAAIMSQGNIELFLSPISGAGKVDYF